MIRVTGVDERTIRPMPALNLPGLWAPAKGSNWKRASGSSFSDEGIGEATLGARLRRKSLLVPDL